MIVSPQIEILPCTGEAIVILASPFPYSIFNLYLEWTILQNRANDQFSLHIWRYSTGIRTSSSSPISKRTTPDHLLIGVQYLETWWVACVLSHNIHIAILALQIEVHADLVVIKRSDID